MSYKIITVIITFLSCINLIAQQTKTYKIYFEVDKHNLIDSEKNNFISFIKKHKTYIKHISFVGYCDDNANNEYNLLLSKKRAIYTKELTYELIKKTIPYSLKYYGELGLKKATNIEAERKENRRVEVTCILSDLNESNSVSIKKGKKKTSISYLKNEGMNYRDFLNHHINSEPNVEHQQKQLDSISEIVTTEEIESFEQEFFKTKINHSLPTDLEYFMEVNEFNKSDRKILLKPSSKKKIKLLSLLMHKYPKLKVKLYTYAYKEMSFKRTNNKEADRFYKHLNLQKISLVINYLTNKGIEKNRLLSEYELVKKLKLNASNIDRSKEIIEIIRLN